MDKTESDLHGNIKTFWLVEVFNSYIGFWALLLEQCSSSFALPSLLYNRSFERDVFSTISKLTFIKPIFESGYMRDIRNYWPIGVIRAILKLLREEGLSKNEIINIVKRIKSKKSFGLFDGIPMNVVQKSIKHCKATMLCDE
ncbi:hypothetical protein HHI36_012523 [Cryptolaemus montrouzieri]|uniref:Maturase K n=1 Tax=Cryptolaemus montrouzieri TaxID=559131 RepID=A0ABD2NEP2_9CUCU